MADFIPAINLSYLEVNGLKVSLVSGTKLSVSAGMARADGNVNDMVLSEATQLDAAIVGTNGIDTGVLVLNTWYAVYLIADPTGFSRPAVLLSASFTDPYMPQNYSNKLLIGYVKTDGSAALLPFDIIGDGRERQFKHATGISVLSAGAITASFTDVDCSAGIPAVDNTTVLAMVGYIPAAASDSVSLRAFGSAATTNLDFVGGVVASVKSTSQMDLLTKLDTGVPKMQYKNSAASGATSIIVQGFEFYI